MGLVRKINRAKLIVGFIYSSEEALKKAQLKLKLKFGKIDFESQAMPFVHTDYYTKEIGDGLKKMFISFKTLIKPESLPKIKLFTNSIENKLVDKGRRPINIDPGYVTLSKLILATTKDYKHRIYLNKGIYSEVTLYYEGNTFMPWEWTYPDYKSSGYITIMNQIRSIYEAQIKKD